MQTRHPNSTKVQFQRTLGAEFVRSIVQAVVQAPHSIDTFKWLDGEGFLSTTGMGQMLQAAVAANRYDLVAALQPAGGRPVADPGRRAVQPGLDGCCAQG